MKQHQGEQSGAGEVPKGMPYLTPVQWMDKVVKSLYLELHESIADDVSKRWQAAKEFLSSHPVQSVKQGQAEEGFEQYMTNARNSFVQVITHYFPHEAPLSPKDHFRGKQWTAIRVASESILIAYDQMRERLLSPSPPTAGAVCSICSNEMKAQMRCDHCRHTFDVSDLENKSCDKSCGPGDYRKGGKCDENGCYESSTAGAVWVKASERLPFHLAFWNIEDGFKKDCTFPVRIGKKYSMGELFDQRLVEETVPKYSISINGVHHFENEHSEIEWLDESSGDKDSERENEENIGFVKGYLLSQRALKTATESILEQQQEIDRLKELIEKLCESCMPEIDCVKYKTENNL